MPLLPHAPQPRFLNSFPDGEFADQSREWDKEVAELQADLQSRLHDVDDILKDTPVPLPACDATRGLVSAAARLTDHPPVESRDQIETRDHVLTDVRDRLSKALESLGLQITEK